MLNNIPITPENRRAIEEYLKSQFPHMRLQVCCGVIAPPENVTIEVFEELQSCHPTNPPAPDLKPGKYLVNRLGDPELDLLRMAHGSSHDLWLRSLEDPEKKLFFECGYAHDIMVDWRGCRRA